MPQGIDLRHLGIKPMSSNIISITLVKFGAGDSADHIVRVPGLLQALDCMSLVCGGQRLQGPGTEDNYSWLLFRHC